MEVKEYYMSFYIIYQRDITQNSLYVYNLVKYKVFPLSGSHECLRTDLFYVHVLSDVRLCLSEGSPSQFENLCLTSIIKTGMKIIGLSDG